MTIPVIKLEDARRAEAKLMRLLNRPQQSLLSEIFPLFLGLLVSTVPVTIAMALNDRMMFGWRWAMQGGFIAVGLFGSWFGWRARRAWRRRR